MKDQRPVNLEIPTMRMTPNMVSSILHRISGIGLFILFPYIVYLLSQSLSSQAGFDAVFSLDNVVVKIVLTFFLAGFSYHFVAGIKHLMMDWGWGETKEGLMFRSAMTIVLGGILFIGLGAWLWL